MEKNDSLESLVRSAGLMRSAIDRRLLYVIFGIVIHLNN